MYAAKRSEHRTTFQAASIGGPGRLTLSIASAGSVGSILCIVSVARSHASAAGWTGRTKRRGISAAATRRRSGSDRRDLQDGPLVVAGQQVDDRRRPVFLPNSSIAFSARSSSPGPSIRALVSDSGPILFPLTVAGARSTSPSLRMRLTLPSWPPSSRTAYLPERRTTRAW